MASTYALSTEIVNGIAVITIDLPGEPVNKFNRAVKDEFVALFDRLERDLNVRAAVLISGKQDSFIAGADIEEFLEFRSPEAASWTDPTLLPALPGGEPLVQTSFVRKCSRPRNCQS